MELIKRYGKGKSHIVKQRGGPPSLWRWEGDVIVGVDRSVGEERLPLAWIIKYPSASFDQSQHRSTYCGDMICIVDF